MEYYPDFTITRVTSTKHGTFGVISQWDTQFALTVEPPWKNNKPFVSCIPAGRYLCKRVDSPRFGVTFELQDVDARRGILFHRGNFGGAVADHYITADTAGCIIIGEEFGELNGVPAVTSSARGFKEFLHRTSAFDALYLTIKDCFS